VEREKKQTCRPKQKIERGTEKRINQRRSFRGGGTPSRTYKSSSEESALQKKGIRQRGTLVLIKRKKKISFVTGNPPGKKKECQKEVGT